MKGMLCLLAAPVPMFSAGRGGGLWRCTCAHPTLTPASCALCPGPGAGGVLRRLALYLFTPAVTSMLHTYGFGELPPQVLATSFFFVCLAVLLFLFLPCTHPLLKMRKSYARRTRVELPP